MRKVELGLMGMVATTTMMTNLEAFVIIFGVLGWIWRFIESIFRVLPFMLDSLVVLPEAQFGWDGKKKRWRWGVDLD